MFRRPNLLRVLTFFIPSLLIVIITHNLVLINFHKKDNLFSLFYVRKDNLTGELISEIYPIALLYRGRYYDASIDVNDHVAGKPNKESYLANFKHFFIFDEEKKLDEFAVAEVTPSQFMCSNILTGKGGLKDSASLSDIFDQMSASKSSQSKGYDSNKDFDFSLKWTLAVSKIKKVPALSIVPTDKDIDRYKADLINIGTPLLSAYVSDDDNGLNNDLTIERISAFDLDHDGKPEVFAKTKKIVRKKVTITQGTEEKEECSNDTVYLNLWLTYKKGSPQVILNLLSYEREGSWGSGYDLVGTIDINGDGIEEVVIRNSGWEFVEFEIYEYRNDKLERVFHGAGFGC
jgi:hypothetical protein